MLLADESAQVGSGVTGIADFELPNLVDESFQEPLVQRGVDKDPTTAQTNLPLIRETGADRRGQTHIQVRILENYVRVLATYDRRVKAETNAAHLLEPTKLQGKLLAVRGAVPHNRLAGDGAFLNGRDGGGSGGGGMF